MAKLITAEQALALSESTYSMETTTKRINENIEYDAKQGKYRTIVKMTEPSHIVDAVVAQLKNVGYKVHYSVMHPKYVILEIWWV